MKKIKLLDFEPIDDLWTEANSDYYHFLHDSIEAMISENDGEIPFLDVFEREIKDRLKAAGFRKNVVNDKAKIKQLAKMLDKYPFKLSSDYPELSMEAKAALYNLTDIFEIRDLLNGAYPNSFLHNRVSREIYLRTIRMMFNAFRSGNGLKLVESELAKIRKSNETRFDKQEIMRAAIRIVFEKYPNTPKTDGGFWLKFKKVHLVNKITRKEYIVEPGENKSGKDCAVITYPNGKKVPYARRSLQRFFDELK